MDDPARIPAYDEVDLALGQNQIRYAIVNRLLARPADPKKGSARGDRVARGRADPRLQASADDHDLGTASGRDLEGRPGRGGSCGSRPGAVLHFDGRLDYDIHASQLTGASATASIHVEEQLRQRHVVREPARPDGAAAGGIALANTDQMRLAAGVDLSKAFRLDTQLNYDATNRTLLEDRRS